MFYIIHLCVYEISNRVCSDKETISRKLRITHVICEFVFVCIYLSKNIYTNSVSFYFLWCGLKIWYFYVYLLFGGFRHYINVFHHFYYNSVCNDREMRMYNIVYTYHTGFKRRFNFVLVKFIPVYMPEEGMLLKIQHLDCLNEIKRFTLKWIPRYMANNFKQSTYSVIIIVPWSAWSHQPRLLIFPVDFSLTTIEIWNTIKNKMFLVNLNLS